MPKPQLFYRDGALVEFMPGKNGYTIMRRGKQPPAEMFPNLAKPRKRVAKVVAPEEPKKKFQLVRENGKELYGY